MMCVDLRAWWSAFRSHDGLAVVGAIRAAITGAAVYARRRSANPVAQRAMAGCAGALNAHQIDQPERLIVGPCI